MSVSRREVMAAAVPLTASLLCGPVVAASGSPRSVEALRGKLTGRLYTPSDAGYGAARRGLGPTTVDDRHPALVVEPASPDDIARTLAFARERGMDISVRSGGHDAFGASTSASGVVIDLSRMAAISVDPATGVARAGAGARAGMLGLDESGRRQ